ncbi:MAG: choice-of-anchor J domain-containing protein [Lacinutrix venerupis]
MKKITLLLLLLSINVTFAQVLFEDDFDGSGPGLAGWTLYDEDGLTPNASVAQFTSAWIEADDFDNTGDVVAMSTSWYDPAGTADDWMVTPAITLTGNAVLTWEEEAQDAGYPDGYEVRVSTTGNAVADFTDVVYSTTAASGAVWSTQSVDLTAYTGSTIYIAWRNNSTDQFVLMINNVSVEVPPAFDVAITSSGELQNQYTQIPLEQISSIGTNATIQNTQAGAVTNAIATVTVTDATNATVYTESSAPYSIAGNATQDVTFTGFTPTAVGTYSTTYTVTITEADGDATNNTFTTMDTVVTTNTYARDDNTVTGTLGIGAGTSGQLGQQFDVLVTEDISSVTFQLEDTNGELAGTTTYVTVWDMVGGVPNAIIAQTDPVTLVAGSNVYTAPIAVEPYTLAPGQYLVAIEEGAFNITLATTTQIFTPGTTWVNWPTNPNGTWSNNEDFNFNVSYLLRPNFQDENLSVDSFSINNITIGLFPNPASNMLTISNPNQEQLEQATITDITGRVVKTYNLNGTVENNTTIDVSSLSSASYFMTIKSNTGAVTKQLIID